MTDDATTSRPAAASVSSEHLLAVFREPRFEPVTVTIADMVTVRMDARYQVVEVALHGRSDESGSVEAALREAFNEAMRQVMERNAARLSALMTQGLSRDAPASAP